MDVKKLILKIKVMTQYFFFPIYDVTQMSIMIMYAYRKKKALRIAIIIIIIIENNQYTLFENVQESR
jgi:hypothetical protein